MIWNADLSSWLTKDDLRHKLFEQHRDNNNRGQPAIRLRFLAKRRQQMDLSHVTIVDIPLSTGVIGIAGPVIHSFTEGIPSDYITTIQEQQSVQQKQQQQQQLSKQQQQQQQQNDVFFQRSTIDAAICVPVYGGEKYFKYLPEFILHHTNIGFEHIVIGVIDSEMDGDTIDMLRHTLYDFIAQGVVSLSPVELEDFDCELNVRKTIFINTCLYYTKSFARHVGIWDLDEFWIPSSTLPTKDVQPESVTSTWKLHDPLWVESNYSTAISISSALNVLHLYQQSAECSQQWCFHSYPSRTVFLKRDGDGNLLKNHDGTSTIGRNRYISHDFDRRYPNVSMIWRKSISRTKYTHFVGLHEGGSCRFNGIQDSPFLSRKETAAVVGTYSHTEDGKIDSTNRKKNYCRNLAVKSPIFGSVHHFKSLARLRPTEDEDYKTICLAVREEGGDDAEEGGCAVDEYIERFGRTVYLQLMAREEKRKNRQGSRKIENLKGIDEDGE